MVAVGVTEQCWLSTNSEKQQRNWLLVVILLLSLSAAVVATTCNAVLTVATAPGHPNCDPPAGNTEPSDISPNRKLYCQHGILERIFIKMNIAGWVSFHLVVIWVSSRHAI